MSQQVDLQGMIQAVQFLEKVLKQSANDDVTLNFDNLPQLSVRNLTTEQLLEQAAVLCSQPQWQPTPTVDMLNKMIDKLVNSPNPACAYTRQELFACPVSTKVAPNYYNVVTFPICFTHIRLRLYANQYLGRDVETCPISPDPSQLLAINFAAYGSMFDQREELERETLKQHSGIRKFYNNKMTVKAQPYDNVEQVFNDLVIICYNCNYFNGTEGGGALQRSAQLLLDDCEKLFREKLALDIPQWVGEMMNRQIFIQERLREAKNEYIRRGGTQ